MQRKRTLHTSFWSKGVKVDKSMHWYENRICSDWIKAVLINTFIYRYGCLILTHALFTMADLQKRPAFTDRLAVSEVTVDLQMIM